MARDLVYDDRLGVRGPGTYQAYAYFNDGKGFAPTALAEAAIEVSKTGCMAAAAAPKTGSESNAAAKSYAGTKTVAAATPKTGGFSPFGMGGLALAALIGAGALALSLARRRD